jgi:hypothetical protein
MSSRASPSPHHQQAGQQVGGVGVCVFGGGGQGVFEWVGIGMRSRGMVCCRTTLFTSRVCVPC